VSTVRQRLMSTAVTFAAVTASWSGGHRDLRSRGIADCPVTAMTVTCCDGRDSTDVRYPHGMYGERGLSEIPSRMPIRLICACCRGGRRPCGEGSPLAWVCGIGPLRAWLAWLLVVI
jgi:hypothetical protein